MATDVTVYKKLLNNNYIIVKYKYTFRVGSSVIYRKYC